MSVVSRPASVVGEASEVRREPPPDIAVLPCVYCRADIAADDFVFWTAARRLLSATCPHCKRRVTLAAATWRRWS